jgi:hypothetical protein
LSYWIKDQLIWETFEYTCANAEVCQLDNDIPQDQKKYYKGLRSFMRSDSSLIEQLQKNFNTSFYMIDFNPLQYFSGLEVHHCLIDMLLH